MTTEIFTCDIMDKDLFWKEGISLVNQDFLFGAWIVPNSGYGFDRRGIVIGHGQNSTFFYFLALDFILTGVYSVLGPQSGRSQG